MQLDYFQEFRVISSTANAEYGRNAGGTINVVTRRGGNRFHGSAFGYFSNDALNAGNPVSVYGGSGCPFNLPGYNDNQWHHVAFVVDASGGKLYVDGFLKGSLPWAGTPGAPSTSQPLHLAHYPQGASSGEYLPGVLDDVRIYNRALSPTEVSELYAATASTFAFTDDPLHNYHDNLGKFPYLRSGGGQNRHSWALLLTPYIEQDAIYQTFKNPITGVSQTDGFNNFTATDPTIVAGQMVRAVHIAELRAAVRVLQ